MTVYVVHGGIFRIVACGLLLRLLPAQHTSTLSSLTMDARFRFLPPIQNDLDRQRCRRTGDKGYHAISVAATSAAAPVGRAHAYYSEQRLVQIINRQQCSKHANGNGAPRHSCQLGRTSTVRKTCTSTCYSYMITRTTSDGR